MKYLSKEWVTRATKDSLRDATDEAATNPNTGTKYRFPRDATRYLGRHRSLWSRNCDTPPCKHGHFECALWERGPCSVEVRARFADPEPAFPEVV